MSKYIHFTEEQKERARRTDIVSFLQSRGKTLKRSGSEHEWKTTSGKVTVRGNIWFHQYEREGGVTLLSHIYSLNNIKSRTVGDGQHGTARWSTKAEIRKTYMHIPFTPKRWRKQAEKGGELKRY